MASGWLAYVPLNAEGVIKSTLNMLEIAKTASS